MNNCKGRNAVVTTKYIPIHDTVTITTERIVEHTKPIFVRDTLLKVDTVYVEKDGIYVELPMEWDEYTDTIKNDSSEARIDIKYHGIAASIDEINLEYKYNREIQTITKPAKKYGLGITIGPTIGYGFTSNISNGTIGHGGYIGIGITIGLDYRIDIK